MEEKAFQINTDERLDALERWKEETDSKFAAAFPRGDHVGHCKYHELMIEQIEGRKRLTRSIQEKTISGLVWAAIIFVGYSVLNYLKDFFKG